MDATARLQHVETFSRHLAAYDGLADGTLFEQIRAPAAQLRGPRVMHVNATPAGGGVAKILRSFVPQQQAVDGVRAGPGVDPRRPLMTQLSRFDPWENPWQVVDVYPPGQTQRPPAAAGHLYADPAQIGAEEVNAFQAESTVMPRRSTRDGFGLSVMLQRNARDSERDPIWQ